MFKKLPRNNDYSNITFSDLPTQDIKQESTTDYSIADANDTVESSFSVARIGNETSIKDVEVKAEPFCTESDEEDTLWSEFDQYGSQVTPNTVVKEEIIIDCGPDEVFEVRFVRCIRLKFSTPHTSISSNPHSA